MPAATSTSKTAVTAPKMAPKVDTAAPAKKAAKVASPVVPATPAPEPATVATAAAAAPAEPGAFEELATLLTNLLSQVKEAQTKLKVLVKEHDKMKKTIEKAEKKRAKARTSPNGFAKPAKISDELADFLGVERGTELPRTEVTRRITAYIKSNDLVNPKNRREIKPDAKLKKVLAVGPNDNVTYFVLQRYLSKHFVKNPVA